MTGIEFLQSKVPFDREKCVISLKKKAHALKKSTPDLKHSAALNSIAVQYGFDSWKDFLSQVDIFQYSNR